MRRVQLLVSVVGPDGTAGGTLCTGVSVLTHLTILRDNGNIGTAEVAQRACGCRSSGTGYWAEHRGTRQAMLVVAHQQEGWTLEGVSEKGRSKHSGLDTTACQLAKLRWGVERVQP